MATGPLILVMVGLPARGKSYTARKLARYLRWQGVSARVFNVGSYRRARLGSGQPATFFDPDNPQGVDARRRFRQQPGDSQQGEAQRERLLHADGRCPG